MEWLPVYVLLDLSIGYGPDLRFHGVAYRSTSSALQEASLGFVTDAESQTTRGSPSPNVPVSIQFKQGREVIDAIDVWLEDIFPNKLDEWLNFSLGTEGFHWHREVLNAVARFSKGKLEEIRASHMRSKTLATILRRAWKLELLSYFMTHQIVMSRDARESVFFQLIQHGIDVPSNPDANFPRLANKIIKMFSISMYHNLIETLLKDLQKLLLNRNCRDNWATAFCIIVILLTVISRMQIALDDLGAQLDSDLIINSDKAVQNRLFAQSQISNMEKQVANFLIKLFHEWYRTRTAEKSYNPFSKPIDCEYLGKREKALVIEVNQVVGRDTSSEWCSFYFRRPGPQITLTCIKLGGPHVSFELI